jgi:hypothetical protein
VGDLAAFMQRLTVTHVRRWHLHRKNVGCGHLYQGTYKSFPVESDEHLLTLLCCVERQRAACGSGGAGRGLAMVDSVARAAAIESETWEDGVVKLYLNGRFREAPRMG